MNMLKRYQKHANVDDMIELHKKILGEQSTAGQFRKKAFNRAELEQQMIDEGYTEYEISILMKSPRMRIQEAADARDYEHQTSLCKKYMDKHSNIAAKMTKDYKKNAINKALTEMYCTN